MRKNLADLVDERHCVESRVAIDSVQRALVKFAEATFLLNVIACEAELKNKQAQETACDGLNVSSKASGGSNDAHRDFFTGSHESPSG